MAVVEPAKRIMGRHLREAIDDLRSDIERLEFWAKAIDELAQPIPGYDAQSVCGLTRFSLTPKSGAADSLEAASRDRACATESADQKADSGSQSGG
jgi:hypothetical protein